MRNFLLFSFFALSGLSFGCAGDALLDMTKCEGNKDCKAGYYCSDDFCVQDCDPTSLKNECEAGFTCDAIGRCVVAGECTKDKDCDSPGSGKCDEANAIRYDKGGKCKINKGVGVCEYIETRIGCEAGCLNGECIEACETSKCINAPSSACAINGKTAITYEAQGFCENNGCSYTQIPVSCADGCLNGECVAGGCDVQPCTKPPKDRCSGSTVYDYGENGVCREEEGAAICDYELERFHCGYVGGDCDAAKCINKIVQVGGVVIVEYQVNPVGSYMDLSEWFEIVNTSGADIDLTNWIIRSKSTSGVNDEHIIGSTGEAVPLFPANGRLLFARAPITGVEIDYDYPARSSGTGITFSNNSDWFQILNPQNEVVDHVFYESGSIVPGSSRKYDPTKLMTATDNDNYKSWCPSLSDEYSAQNFGTPGEVNTACSADPCLGFECVKPMDFCARGVNRAVSYLADTAQCRKTRFNNPYCDYKSSAKDCNDATELCAYGICETIPATTPKASGELIISEIMANPVGADTSREWIEIHNASGTELSLFGMHFQSIESNAVKQKYQILDVNAVVPAMGYTVLIRNTDPMGNGGVTGAYKFSGTHLKNTNYYKEGVPADPNDDVIRTLRLTALNGTLLDEAYYGNLEVKGAPIKSGISNQLQPANLNASDNDIAANWCEATTSYGEGGQGTPGAANICP